MPITPEQIRQECWDKAQQCLATHYIFRRKSEIYERYIRVNTLLGILTPLTLGAVIATYGLEGDFSKIALLVAGPLSIIQVILSGLAVVNKWDSLLSYSVESLTANRIAYDSFVRLAKYPPADFNQHKNEYEKLSIIASEREMQDEKIHFSPKEDRIGTRYALWIMQRTCPVCKKTPTSSRRSNSLCGTCDKPHSWFSKLFLTTK